jgi:hypothetical protein
MTPKTFAELVLVTTGGQGANSDLKHPLRQLWETAREVLAQLKREKEAAPEILEALHAMLDEHADCKGCDASNLAFAAIAKAEGR